MSVTLEKLLAASLLEALDIALNPELSDPAFWMVVGIIAMRIVRTGDSQLAEEIFAEASKTDRAVISHDLHAMKAVWQKEADIRRRRSSNL